MEQQGVRGSLMITPEQYAEMSSIFRGLDLDGNGFIEVKELGEALESLGIKLPGYQLRDIVNKYDHVIKDDRIDINEFQEMYASLKDGEIGRKFKTVVHKREGLQVVTGTSTSSAEGTTHSIRSEEQIAFSNWVNRNLEDDPDCRSYLPLVPESRDLYLKCNNGILFCKMINKSQPDTIDERAINKGEKLSIYQVHENLTLAINSAQSIGCNVVNIGPEDLHAGKPHLVLGLLWQIIRIGLLSDINLHEHPNLAALLRDGETLEDLMKLSPEEILLRWVNYHLAKSDCGRQVSNFGSDIKDSIAYIHLLHQISPRDAGVSTAAEHEEELKERAERMLQEADKIGCRSFVSPADVVGGNTKLNLAFVANLFNTYPALDPVDDLDFPIVAETREEKTYRNWMNSMGVSPYVNHLYNDLCDGLIIFQLYDIIKAGVVDWKKVITKFHKMRVMMEKIENCNYAVELGRKSKFSLVGIDGKDIYDGNQTLTLALVWQLMKAYTLSILSKLADEEDGKAMDKNIVAWANTKLRDSGKASQITGFSDNTISNGVVILDLIDAIKPNSVKQDLIKTGNTEQDKLDNAKYAISMARKIGARVYALPEDIVEVKTKMVMTVFACLMIKDLKNKQQQEQSN